MHTSYLFIDTFPYDSHEEHRAYRRSQIAGDGLDVVEETTSLRCLNNGNPQDTNTNHDQNEDTKAREQRKGKENHKIVIMNIAYLYSEHIGTSRCSSAPNLPRLC